MFSLECVPFKLTVIDRFSVWISSHDLLKNTLHTRWTELRSTLWATPTLFLFICNYAKYSISWVLLWFCARPAASNHFDLVLSRTCFLDCAFTHSLHFYWGILYAWTDRYRLAAKRDERTRWSRWRSITLSRRINRNTCWTKSGRWLTLDLSSLSGTDFPSCKLVNKYRIDVFFVARDSIYAKRAYAIAIPSVRLSVTRVIHAKTVEVRILQFSPYSSPIPLVLAR